MQGRVAVITGGAGHLGQAFAEALAQTGCGLLLIDLQSDRLHKVANELQTKWGTEVKILAIDLEKEEERQLVRAFIIENFGRVDVLINNAGFVGDTKVHGWAVSFENQSLETWRRALEVNLTAAFHLSQDLLDLLRSSGHGSIVNIGSIYGVVGPDLDLYKGTSMGNPAAYAASKGGLIHFTKWLATVLAPYVRVNCISPGGVFRNQPKSFVDKYVEKTPLKRMGEEEDFIGAMLFFASDLSSWVTGQNLLVDGGWTTW